MAGSTRSSMRLRQMKLNAREKIVVQSLYELNISQELIKCIMSLYNALVFLYLHCIFLSFFWQRALDSILRVYLWFCVWRCIVIHGLYTHVFNSLISVIGHDQHCNSIIYNVLAFIHSIKFNKKNSTRRQNRKNRINCSNCVAIGKNKNMTLNMSPTRRRYSPFWSNLNQIVQVWRTLGVGMSSHAKFGCKRFIIVTLVAYRGQIYPFLALHWRFWFLALWSAVARCFEIPLSLFSLFCHF